MYNIKLNYISISRYLSTKLLNYKILKVIQVYNLKRPIKHFQNYSVYNAHNARNLYIIIPYKFDYNEGSLT